MKKAAENEAIAKKAAEDKASACFTLYMVSSMLRRLEPSEGETLVRTTELIIGEAV